jgi:Na+-driven multidrug efflux pump
MIEWSLVVGVGFGVILALSRPWLVPVFTDDPGVRHLADELLLIVALLQPLNAFVFVLDGVLIGAGDQRFLAMAMLVATLGVYAPAALAISATGGGVMALWGALSLWFCARAVGLGARYSGPSWQVTGATRV